MVLQYSAIHREEKRKTKTIIVSIINVVQWILFSFSFSRYDLVQSSESRSVFFITIFFSIPVSAVCITVVFTHNFHLYYNESDKNNNQFYLIEYKTKWINDKPMHLPLRGQHHKSNHTIRKQQQNTNEKQQRIIFTFHRIH